MVIESNTPDTTIWDFDRIGDDIVAVRSKGNNVRPFFSKDGGDTWIQDTVSFGTDFTANNTSHYFEFSPIVKMIDSDNCFILYPTQPTASDIKYEGIVGTKNSAGDWNFVAANGGSVILSDNGSNNVRNGQVIYRDGKLYAFQAGVGNGNITMSVSTDNGVTWGSQLTVQNNTTPVVLLGPHPSPELNYHFPINVECIQVS